MKKILILYAMYGSGHRTVANNIYDNIKNENVEVELLDITNYANFWGKRSFNLFDFVLKYRPEKLYDVSYELLDNKIVGKSQNFISRLFFDNIELRKKIKNFNPDLVICTHYYAATLVVNYNKTLYLNSKIMSIITDYVSHNEWLTYHKNKDVFIVPNGIVKQELIDKGVDKKKVYSYGIPVKNDLLYNLTDKSNVLKKYKIDNNLPIILFFGGSTSGSLTYLEYFKTLTNKNIKANIIFISGKNKKLETKAKLFIRNKNKKNVTVLGYTNDVYNLLNISSFVITKPGGATITECMAFKKPLILVPGLGGQERYNIKYLKKAGFGVFVRRKAKLVKVTEDFLNPKYIKKFEKKLNERANINSCGLICDLAKDMIK